MPEIETLVEQLAVQTTKDGQAGRPLLVQLRRAVYGDIGQTVVGAAQVWSTPLNAGAFDLWTEISAGVAGLYSSTTDKTPSRSTVVNLLAWCIAFAVLREKGEITDLMLEKATGRLNGWVVAIERLLANPLSVPLRDFACPNCGASRAEWGEKELRVQGDAVVIELEDGQLVARCRTTGCTHLDGSRTKWVGDTEVLYMARRAGIDVDSLAEKVREARLPMPELPYDSNRDRRVLVLPEQPDYAAEFAAAVEDK